MKITISLSFFLLISLAGFSQERFGIASSNYAPTQSMFLNPASIVDSKAYRDIHIVGAGLFFDNDLVYMSKNDFKLTRGQSQFENAPMPLQKQGPHKRHGYADVLIQGPSFTAVFGRLSLGFHTAARTVVDFRGISQEMSNFMFEGLSYMPQRDVVHREENMRASALSWAEAGITLGGVLVQNGPHMLSAAITPRRLIGASGGGLQVDDFSFLVGDSSYMDVENFTAQAGYAMPEWNAGRGWGFNAGFEYKRMREDVTHYRAFSKESGCEGPQYKYKIGLSILDVGSIQFDRNASYYSADGLVLNMNNYNDELPGSMEEVDSLFNADVMGQLATDGSFRMALPTALSLQFDLHVAGNFYASAAWVHGFARRRNLGVQRSGVINLTPRFEHQRIEVALPITLYQYRYPRMGLAFRFNSIVIGTDRLGPLLFNPDVYGMDLYFGIKHTIFKSRACRGRKVQKAKVDDSRMMACPTWN